MLYSVRLSLSSFSLGATRAFREFGPWLLNFVNSNFLHRKDLVKLIGSASNQNMMIDNHRNHHAFMLIVFMTKSSELLLRTLPWVYQTYHHQGFSYEYFRVELQLWKSAIAAYLPLSAVTEINAVYKFMLDHHEETIAQAKAMEPHEEHLDKVQKEFLHLLLKGDQEGAIAFAENRINTASELEPFYDTFIRPALYQVGNLWQQGKISVAAEHMCTNIATRLVSLFHFPNALASSAGRILLSAGTNEYHELGALMIANLFETYGWQVYFLGANTPGKDTVALAKDLQPDVIGLSVAMVTNFEAVIEVVTTLKADSDTKNIFIILGGQICSSIPEITAILPVDFATTSFQQALHHASMCIESS